MLGYPNERAHHVTQELQRELSDLTMPVNLHRITLISGDLVRIRCF